VVYQKKGLASVGPMWDNGGELCGCVLLMVCSDRAHSCVALKEQAGKRATLEGSEYGFD